MAVLEFRANFPWHLGIPEAWQLPWWVYCLSCRSQGHWWVPVCRARFSVSSSFSNWLSSPGIRCQCRLLGGSYRVWVLALGSVYSSYGNPFPSSSPQCPFLPGFAGLAHAGNWWWWTQGLLWARSVVTSESKPSVPPSDSRSGTAGGTCSSLFVWNQSAVPILWGLLVLSFPPSLVRWLLLVSTVLFP